MNVRKYAHASRVTASPLHLVARALACSRRRRNDFANLQFAHMFKEVSLNMNVNADIIDPDDVMYLEKFVALNKRFTLTWDDIIRKGLEEWDKLVQMDEEADRAEKMRA